VLIAGLHPFLPGSLLSLREQAMQLLLVLVSDIFLNNIVHAPLVLERCRRIRAVKSFKKWKLS